MIGFSNFQSRIPRERLINDGMKSRDEQRSLTGDCNFAKELAGEYVVTAGPLRVTAVMQKRGDKWLIVQFHNSPTPKPPPAVPPVVPPG